MKYVLLIILSFLVSSSIAAPSDTTKFKVTWSAPTERVNGKPLTAEEIAGYTVAFRLINTEEWTFVDTDKTEMEFELPTAVYELGVFCVDTNQVYSDMSNTIFHGIATKPPTDIKVQAQIIININSP